MKKICETRTIQYYLSQTDFTTYFSFPIEHFVELCSFDKGENILSEGNQPARYLYFLVSGRAKLFCTLSNGKLSLLDFIENPCFLGELELLNIRKNTMGVKALTSCLLFALPIHECHDLLLADNHFLQILCQNLAQKEEQRMRHLIQMQGFPLINRLAQFILFASSNGHYTERNTDASAYLGTSYRHLTQIFREFVELGYLTKTTLGYDIADETQLCRLAAEMEVE